MTSDIPLVVGSISLEKCGNRDFFVDSACIANAIPKSYFVASGTGESDNAIDSVSYHMALQDAGIAMCNIMKYSSILPEEAVETEKPKLVHGMELKSIEARANSRKGERATAGICYGWLYDNAGKKHGGLVLEYPDSDMAKKHIYTTELAVKEALLAGLDEIAKASYPGLALRDVKTVIKSFRPKKDKGTSLVALCFTNFIVPVNRINFCSWDVFAQDDK